MKVHGVEIPQRVISDAEQWCLDSSGFWYTALCEFISEAKLTAPSDRVAQRILQRLKKAGKIEYSGGLWRVVNHRVVSKS